MGAPSGSHGAPPLRRADLLDDPVAQFRRWFDDAIRAGLALPHAMALATADADGRPSVRHVLLRGVDARGFAFFTNRDSRKGRDLGQNPHAAAVFLWRELDRQVSLSGRVERTSDEESDAYFAARPRGAQVGAWASPQSSVLSDRALLDAAVAEVEARFGEGPLPRPPHWGGYRIVPDEIELWQGREHRLHDRFRYARGDEGRWRLDRLAP
ncbi:MAG TPA: pyridoxamine 5'-phosphate oxidase [Actinomycetota bacterium]